MYFTHFGLNQSPFSITPNPDFFYSGSKRGDILEALIYAVGHGEGIVKVTGEVGSGKTMLCRMLEGMMPENVEVIYLVNPTLSREEVMFTIAGELEIPTEGKRPDEVIRLLHQDLIAKHICGKQVVLLVEEAQAMSLETLEEIRLFSNLETARHKLLQIVLFGQPELDLNLNLPSMRQLKERITHSFTVPPLAPNLMSEFLMFRMRTAGYHGPDLFTKGAIKLLSTVSCGIVRRINVLADKALLAAFAENTHAIEVKHVRAAINDSEFSSPSRFSFSQQAVLIALAILIAVILLVDIGMRIEWPTMLGSSKQIALDQSRTQTQAKKQVVLSTDKNHVVPASSTSAAASIASLSNEKGRAGEAANVISATPDVMYVNKAVVPPKEHSVDVFEPAVKSHIHWKDSAPITRDRIIASKKWLREMQGDLFTIQIALVDAENLEKLERFLKKTSLEIDVSQLFLYPTRMRGGARFGIVYMGFSSRIEARNKRMELDQQWNYQSQLRTISGLRSDMRRSQSEDLW